MAIPQGIPGQATRVQTYRADLTITTGSVSQLLLPLSLSRSYLSIQCASAIRLESGSARATATLTGGAVTSVTVTNGGFGFTKPPAVQFLAGAPYGTYGPAIGGCGLPGYAAPNGLTQAGVKSKPAKAHAVLTAGVVTSIVIDDPGAGYGFAPYVQMTNSHADPFGCADANYNTTASGLTIAAGGNYFPPGVVPTQQIAVWCATQSAYVYCEWAL